MLHEATDSLAAAQGHLRDIQEAAASLAHDLFADLGL